jgi:hypothetical protein
MSSVSASQQLPRPLLRKRPDLHHLYAAVFSLLRILSSSSHPTVPTQLSGSCRGVAEAGGADGLLAQMLAARTGSLAAPSADIVLRGGVELPAVGTALTRTWDELLWEG